MDRDPRKRIQLDQTSSAIYNLQQSVEYKSSSRSPGPNNNHSTKFQSKDEKETRSGNWNERSNNFSRNSDKFGRNFQESFRGRGRGMHSRGQPFSRHSYDNSRFRSNQRSPISFKDRSRLSDERSQSSFRDNPKRKRSQSPNSYTSRQMPKRRSSYNQLNDNKELKDTEKFNRESSTGSKYSTDDSDSRNAQLDKTISNIEIKVVRKDDKTPLSEKKESELPANLSEAIKKIQSIKIPKVSMNKSASKTEEVKKDVDSSKNSDTVNLENNSTETMNKSLDLQVAIDKLKTVTAKSKCETLKNTKVNEENAETNLDSNEWFDRNQNADKNEAINIDNKPEISSNTEIGEDLKSEEVIQDIDGTKPPTNTTDKQNVDEFESTTNENIEAEKKNSELGLSNSLILKTAEAIVFEGLEETIEMSTDTLNEEGIITNKVINDANNSNEIKNDQIVQSTSSTSDNVSRAEVNETDEQKPIDKQNELESLNISKNVSTPKASALTSLLENQEDDPEKVLEGLISVLGAEKVKKMQELLLKKTIESKNVLEVKTEESSEADKNIPKEVDEKEITLLESKTVSELEKTSAADHEFDFKNAEEINDINETVPIQINVSTPDTQQPLETSPVKKSSLSPEKKRKKPRKKKLTELDKLHENILSSIDCEGIMRACGQPRVSIKPKTYEVSYPINKSQETKPFTLKILRLNLTTDDMPVVLNDEFYQEYLTIQETTSRTKPKPRKKRTISQEKPAMKVPKIEPDFETEPSSLLVDTEILAEGIQNPVQPLNEIQMETNLKTEVRSSKASNIKKKRKQKLLSWSKGILKKKPKRFKLSSLYEWEDVDSSDDNTSFDRTMKLKKFKNLLDVFAKKCGYKKISKKTDIHPTLQTINQKINNSAKRDLNGALDEADMTKAIDKSTVNEDDTEFAVPKRINLPLEKNFLTMISNKNSSEIKSPTNTSESPSLKITIKLPTVEKSVQSTSPTIQQTQQSDDPVAGSSNESNTKIYSSQNNPQKVVIVKPLSKETQNETVRVRSLSAQEQQALKDSLLSSKNQTPAPSIAQQNEKIIKNMKTNLNTSLNITKITTQKSGNVSTCSKDTSKKEPVKKSIPIISNVESISPKGSKAQDISNKEQIKTSKFISIESTAASSKTQENVIVDFNESVPLLTNKNEPTHNKPDSIEPSMLKNEPVEIVDLIDDDDDDDVVDIMRPWIEKSEYKSRKDQIEAIKMINNVHCLASLYKCMGSTCSYFSNDKSLFQKHLELHRDHQKTDSQNYLLCCYCSFRPKSINVLLVHIENAHSYGKFGYEN